MKKISDVITEELFVNAYKICKKYSEKEFITDINQDAIRRDFRCNAVYYDILEEEIVDPLNGFGDINNKLIQTTTDPEIVFKDDAERILRMVRFASQLGFEIEKTRYVQTSSKRHFQAH